MHQYRHGAYLAWNGGILRTIGTQLIQPHERKSDHERHVERLCHGQSGPPALPRSLS